MSKSYYYSWAEGVYITFRKCFARASAIFHKLHNIKDFTVISWVASDQLNWEKYKKIVKRIDRWDKMHVCPNIDDYPIQVLRSLKVVLTKEFDFYAPKGDPALDRLLAQL